MDSFELTSSAGVPSRLLDQARGDARAVGYAQGWSQGLREAVESQAAALVAAQAAADRAAAARLAALNSVLGALGTAAEKFAAETVRLTDDIADQILAAAVQLATVLLGQELAQPATSATAALARALAAAPGSDAITVRLSAADHAVLSGPDGPALLAALDNSGRQIVLELDPALARGDALARSGVAAVDARLSEAVRRLSEGLSA